MGKKKTLIALATAVLVAVSCVQPIAGKAAKGSYTLPSNEDDSSVEIQSYASPQAKLASMTLVSEDDYARLYYDVQTAQVALENKQDSKIWFSSPYTLSEANADDDFKEQIASPVRLTYLDKSLQRHEYNSFANAAKAKQITSKLIDGGIAAQMVIGEVDQKQLLPTAMPEASFDGLMKKVTSSQARRIKANYMKYNLENYTDESIRKELLQKYPGLQNSTIYVLKDVNNTVAKELEGYIKSTDYTYDQMNADESAVLGANKDKDQQETAAKACFKLRVEYTLEKGQLVVRLPADSIQYDTGNFTLENVYLLEYFGAAQSSDNGYLMLPDGSGAVVDFQGNSANTGVVIQSKVYGPDSAQNYDRSDFNKKQMQMPVYGLKVNNSAFLTVIEDGSEQSEIYGVIKEGESGYCKAGALFHINSTDEFTYAETDGSGATSSTYNRTSKNTYTGNLTLRVIPLAGDKADYSGMAVAYRKYLVARGDLKAKTTSSLPLYYGALGAVDHQEKILMFPVTRSVALTSYSNMITVAKELKAGGITNLNIRYIGWANGGLKHTVFNRLRLMSSLGGANAFKKLVQYTNANKIGLYPDVDLAYCRYNTWFDGYFVNGQTARQLDDTYARTYPIDYGSDMEEFNKPELALKPSVMSKNLGSFLKSYEKYGANGLSLSDLGTDLHADNSDSGGVNRSQSRQMITEMLKKAAGSYNVMVDGGNAYTYAYADHILNLPSTSSGYVQATASIPFMQMVLHGYISYAGEPINLSSETKKATLKAIENGEALYFVLAAENYQVLSDTDFADYFSVDYATWKSRIFDTYAKVNSCLSGTYSATIEKHEILASNVVKVTYSNGCSIVINYRDTAFTVNGQTVPAEDALVLQAG